MADNLRREVPPHESMIALVGFSRTFLSGLRGRQPGSVLVIEEPDVIAQRQLADSTDQPAVAQIIPWEYQTLGREHQLLQTFPILRTATAVIPGVEYAVPAAARLAAALGLPGAGTNAADIFRDKAQQRILAGRAGIYAPRHQVVADDEEAARFIRRQSGPCVIKPTARQAGLGVLIVSGPEHFASLGLAATRDANEPLLVPRRGIPSGILVEEAMAGREYSVELLLANGEPVFSNLTTKRVQAGTYPVELGHTVPSASRDITERLVRQTRRLAAEARFRDGMLHCEWIVGSHGDGLVECAARMPGDEITALIGLAYDFPVVDAYLDVLSGRIPDCPRSPTAAASIRFLTAPPGKISFVGGAELAEAVPGVTSVKISAHVGATSEPVTSSWQRLGHVIATGPSPAAAEAAAERAAGLIEIRVDAAPEVG